MQHAASLGIIILVSVALRAEILPSGTGIELRSLRSVGSKMSHPGDSIEAVVIAPVVTKGGDILIFPGATLSGRVQSVGRLGLGLKRARASIELQFDTLHLPGHPNLPIHTQLQAVETAKERVREDGMVGGIRPAASVSSTASFYVLPIICLNPDFGLPVLAVKFLIARSPDSEIFFPRGTEFILRVVDPLDVPVNKKEPN